MARYIKANPLVAKFLHLEYDRYTVKDGNYILWQSDVLPFGPLTQLSDTLTAIGAIALMPHEAKEEQDGIVLRPLPEATDARFIMPKPQTPAEEMQEAAEQPSDTENDDAPQDPADTDQENN